jgi:hypothetical protein
MTSSLLTEDLDRVDEIRFYGLLASARLRLREWQLAARQAARTAERIIGYSLPTAVYSFEGYSGMAEVYLSLWENELEARGKDFRILQKGEFSEFRREAQNAINTLKRFARTFKMGLPRAYLYTGLFYWLDGKEGKARKYWQKSLHLAERLGMPYEEGLACYEIGRHSRELDQIDWLNRAARIFESLKAEYYLSQINDALS